MSENDNSRFSWLGQLQELYNTSAKSVLKSVLDPVFYHLNTLNPEAPKVQIEKNTSDAETFNPTAPTAQTNNRNTDDAETLITKEPNFRRIRKETIYDKVYEDFIFNYKRFNDEGSAFDDQKLRGEFNSLLIKKYNKDNPPNNLKKLTKPVASLAFSITLTRLSEVDNLRASKGEFELLLTDQTELHAIIAKKYFDKHPNAFSVVDEQGSSKNKNPNLQDSISTPAFQLDEKNQEAPNADCPSAFSVVKDYLFNATSAATTFLTSTASSFVSFMFDSNKAPNSQSNQDPVPPKTATIPTTNQTPTTAPKTGEYETISSAHAHNSRVL